MAKNRKKINEDSILNEYFPLIHPSIDITLGEDDYGSYGIGYSLFEWCLKEKGLTDKHVYEDNKTLEFIGSSLLYKEITIDGKETAIPQIEFMTKNKFRLPDFGVGIGIGPKTIFLSDRIFEQLQISEKLGTSSGKAILNDPFGGKHEGYNYLSFIHPLSLKRAEKRLHRIPIDKRPFIFLKPSKHKEVIFIHKNLITLWTQLGCTGIVPNYHETYSKYKGWDYLYINIDYASLEDWQTNNYTIYKEQL